MHAAFIKHVFLDARTHYHWQDRLVSDSILKDIYDAAKMGPTSANTNPLRIVFVKSSKAKNLLKTALNPTNIDKTISAPVTAIFAQDIKFYNSLDYLFPHNPNMKSVFTASNNLIQQTAFRNATLQAAYFMITARAYGLDCGPISGFDNKKVDQLFFSETNFESNFISNLGYGQSNKTHPRLPRFNFEDVCKIM